MDSRSSTSEPGTHLIAKPHFYKEYEQEKLQSYARFHQTMEGAAALASMINPKDLI